MTWRRGVCRDIFSLVSPSPRLHVPLSLISYSGGLSPLRKEGARRRDADAPRALQSWPFGFPARHRRLYGKSFMSEHGKCPMGKHPWLATFLVLAFVLVFLAHKLGLL